MSSYAVQQTATPGVLVIEGSFTTAGTSAPTTLRGGGYTLSAPSTGAYTLTLADHLRGTRVVSMIAQTEEDSGAAAHVAFFRSGSATTGLFVIQTQSGAGTAANLTGPRVNFRISLSTLDVEA